MFMKKEKKYYEEPSVQVINFQDKGAIFTDMNGTIHGSPGSEDFDEIFGEDNLPV